MLCPNCGQNMSDDTKFCTICGASMNATQSTPEQQPQTELAPSTQAHATQLDAQAAVAPAPAPQPVSVPTAQPTPTPIPQAASVFQTNSHAAPAVATGTPSQSNKLFGANGINAFIPLAVAVIALILAIVGLFGSGSNAEKLQAVDGGIATITIKASEKQGTTKILPDNSNYIVVATSIGGNSTFGDVMFDSSSGELVLYSTSAPKSDTQRSVSWVAYTK